MTDTFQADSLFHLDDPDTSRVAAINLDGTDTERICHAIITLIDERGALAPFELERAYHDVRGRRDWPRAAFHTIHKRASQMKKQIKVLRGTGERVKTPGGSAAERLGLAMDQTYAHTLVTQFFKPQP